MLSKKMIRDIKNHKSQFLSIFLMAFLGVFVFAGIGGEYTGFEQSVNDYYDATNLADGWIYSSHLDNSTVDKVDNLSATTASERQLVINSVGDFDNDPDVTLHFVENNDISKFYLVEGKDVDIDKSRLIRCLGRLDEYEMEEVEEALSVRLGCFDDSLSINVDNPIYFENIRFFFLHVENRTCHWHWIRFFLIIIFTFTWSIGYTSFIYPCKKVGYLFFPMFKCLYNIIIC